MQSVCTLQVWRITHGQAPRRRPADVHGHASLQCLQEHVMANCPCLSRSLYASCDCRHLFAATRLLASLTAAAVAVDFASGCQHQVTTLAMPGERASCAASWVRPGTYAGEGSTAQELGVRWSGAAGSPDCPLDAGT